MYTDYCLSPDHNILLFIFVDLGAAAVCVLVFKLDVIIILLLLVTKIFHREFRESHILWDMTFPSNAFQNFKLLLFLCVVRIIIILLYSLAAHKILINKMITSMWHYRREYI